MKLPGARVIPGEALVFPRVMNSSAASKLFSKIEQLASVATISYVKLSSSSPTFLIENPKPRLSSPFLMTIYLEVG